MEKLKYVTLEWAQEAYRRLKEELTPEKMKFVTSSMLTLYTNCPDGKDRALYYRFVDGAIEQVSLCEGEMPEAEFIISGEYETFARISRAEIGSRSALMSGKLRLKGNMVKALSLAAVVDRMNKVLATIPSEY
ncbi:MAG: SCP2 sterol-binding domain-containing protein [Anaerolineales bacterium]|nr:SCP2 sterol-binding domain-containing protein [Anaerolineales bacterium]